MATPGMTNGKWREKASMAGGKRRVKRVDRRNDAVVLVVVVGLVGLSESEKAELMSVEVRSRQSWGLGKVVVVHMMILWWMDSSRR
jgi:hypothetical protein